MTGTCAGRDYVEPGAGTCHDLEPGGCTDTTDCPGHVSDVDMTLSLSGTALVQGLSMHCFRNCGIAMIFAILKQTAWSCFYSPFWKCVAA